MKRHYFRVAPYALVKILNALDNDKEHACNIMISLEDDEILVSYDEVTTQRNATLHTCKESK